MAKIPQAVVSADVFLLTDRTPSLLGLDPGVQVEASEPASATLLSDLRSDSNSQWILSQAWLTYIAIGTPAAQLNHDLAIDPSGAGRPSAIEAGYETPNAAPAPFVASLAPVVPPSAPGEAADSAAWLWAVLCAAGLVVVLVGWILLLWSWSPDPSSSAGRVIRR